MIEDNTIWYLGSVGSGENYRLAKYTDVNMSALTSSTTSSKVGLLRYGELMASQFERYTEKGETSSTDLAINYWTLTPYKLSNVRYVGSMGDNYNNIPINTNGVKPSIN